MKTKIAFSLPIIAWTLLLSAGLASANLITNGGFETGDFTGWTQGGNTGFTFVSTGYAHSGTYGAQLGPVGSDGYLSQTLATTPGNLYTFSFWLQGSGRTPNDFSASFNGVTVYTVTDSPAFSYTEFTFTGLLATSSSTTVQFAFRDDPSYWGLDDVSVSGATSTPETGTSALLLSLGLVGLCLARRALGGRGAAVLGA
jgi:hypothetical protein